MQKGYKFLNGIFMYLEGSFRDGLYLGGGIWHLLREKTVPKSSMAEDLIGKQGRRGKESSRGQVFEVKLRWKGTEG